MQERKKSAPAAILAPTGKEEGLVDSPCIWTAKEKRQLGMRPTQRVIRMRSITNRYACSHLSAYTGGTGDWGGASACAYSPYAFPPFYADFPEVSIGLADGSTGFPAASMGCISNFFPPFLPFLSTPVFSCGFLSLTPTRMASATTVVTISGAAEILTFARNYTLLSMTSKPDEEDETME